MLSVGPTEERVAMLWDVDGVYGHVLKVVYGKVWMKVQIQHVWLMDYEKLYMEWPGREPGDCMSCKPSKDGMIPKYD